MCKLSLGPPPPSFLCIHTYWSPRPVCRLVGKGRAWELRERWVPTGADSLTGLPGAAEPRDSPIFPLCWNSDFMLLSISAQRRGQFPARGQAANPRSRASRPARGFRAPWLQAWPRPRPWLQRPRALSPEPREFPWGSRWWHALIREGGRPATGISGLS